MVRSDYSGATYFLTRWFEHMWPSQWSAFCQRIHPGIKLPCPETELYPQNFGNAKAENGSNNVAAYITSSFANGAIGYDEYAYALNAHFPVVKLLNPGGYFVLPTADNVSVALTKAVINEDRSSPSFLQQNLDGVYTYTDPRSYPLSSYSYFIVPRTAKPPPIFLSPSGKGLSLSAFIDYMLCGGQATKFVDALGYASLPLNLVQGGFYQSEHIPGHGPVPNPNTVPNCPNPTFQSGHDILLTQAPFPSVCDKLGAPLNCAVRNGKAVQAGGKRGKSVASPTASAGPGAAGTGNGSPGTGPTGASGGPVTSQVVNVAASQASQTALGALTALGIVAAVAAPPLVAVWLRRRGQANG